MYHGYVEAHHHELKKKKKLWEAVKIISLVFFSKIDLENNCLGNRFIKITTAAPATLKIQS